MSLVPNPPRACADIVLDVFALAIDAFDALPKDYRTQFGAIAHLKKRHGDQMTWMRSMWLHLVQKKPRPSLFDCYVRDLSIYMSGTAPRNAKQVLADLCFRCCNRMKPRDCGSNVEITVPDISNDSESLLTMSLTVFIERMRAGRELSKDEKARACMIWLYYFQDNVIVSVGHGGDESSSE